MPLTTKQNQFLRGKAHRLKPAVIIGGAGLTDAVLAEIKLALAHHELIKVKINAGERDERQEMISHITTACDCQHVQTIGRIGVFYKPGEEKKIDLAK